MADLTQTEFSGPLRKLDADTVSGLESATIEPGAIVLVDDFRRKKVRQATFLLASRGAAAILMLARQSHAEKHFEEGGTQDLPKLSDRLQEDSADDLNVNVIELNQDAFSARKQMPEGATIRFEAPSSDKRGATWNAVGILRGSDPSLATRCDLVLGSSGSPWHWHSGQRRQYLQRRGR